MFQWVDGHEAHSGVCLDSFSVDSEESVNRDIQVIYNPNFLLC